MSAVNHWVRHDGGPRPVAEDQLVELVCVGEGGPWLAEAGSIRWEWRDGILGGPHHGNIIRYRLRAQIKITLTVPDTGNVSVHTKASPMPEAWVRPMLDRAIAAIQGERDALETCPFHGSPPSNNPKGEG